MLIAPTLTPTMKYRGFLPFRTHPTYSSSFIHEYFNIHQNNEIASTYNASKAKDSLRYLDCIPETISHETKLSRRTRGDKQFARCAGWLACGSASTVLPGTWDSIHHCRHYRQIPPGGYLALCSEVPECFRTFANLLNWNFCCLCPIGHVMTVCFTGSY